MNGEKRGRKSGAFKMWLLSMLVLVVLGLAGSYGYSRISKGEVEKVRMSYVSATCELTNLLAYEKGYYSDEGIEVELNKFESSNQVTDALLAEKIDISGCFAYPVAFSVEAVKPNTIKSIRSIITSSEYPYLWLVVKKDDKSINSVKDLANKKVGRFPGTTTEAQLKHALKTVGVDPTTVTMQPIAPAQQINALASGSVDAVFVLEPISTVAEMQGIGRKVESLEKYLVEPNYNALYGVLKSYEKAHSSIVKKVIKAQDKAVSFLRENPEESKRVLAKYMPYDEATLVGAGMGYPMKSNEKIDKQKAQDYADLLFSEGDLKTKIETKNFFEN